MIELRDYQQECVEGLRAAFASGHRAPLLVLPTGGGKTFIFSYIAMSAAAKGSRVVILAHRDSLLWQASQSLTDIGVKHGMIAAGWNWALQHPVQVASVQTIIQKRRLAMLEGAGWSPDLIIVDEAHHAAAGSWKRIIEAFPRARLLGVTATPCRLDGKGLGVHAGGVFDAMVEGPQIADLIDRGHLSEFDVYAPPVQFDLAGVKRTGGDWNRGEVAARVDKPKIVGDAVRHYSRICPGAPGVGFCVSIAHAHHMREAAAEAGYQAAAIDGTAPTAERRRVLRDLGAGALNLLFSCDLISEGTDVPAIVAAINLRPTQSLSLYIQQNGRALRRAPGKDRAIILDHAGNTQRHGMLDAPREWSLDGMTRKSRDPKEAEVPPPVTCEKCWAQIARPAPPACPLCGESLAAANERFADMISEGELVKVGEEERRVMRMQRVQEEVEAKTLQDLIELGRRRGYKHPFAWATRKMDGRRQRLERRGWDR